LHRCSAALPSRSVPGEPESITASIATPSISIVTIGAPSGSHRSGVVTTRADFLRSASSASGVTGVPRHSSSAPARSSTGESSNRSMANSMAGWRSRGRG